MGTRSLTFVYDGRAKVMCLYRQFDGYPSGHGSDLAKFLESGTLVNGYSTKGAPQFNGMGCLAAQLVAKLKDGVGNFYLYPTSTKDAGQEYEYHVYEDKIVIRECNYSGGSSVIFSGTWKEFGEFCNATN